MSYVIQHFMFLLFLDRGIGREARAIGRRWRGSEISSQMFNRMTKYYVFFDKANNRFECVPKRYRRLRDARQALREYRYKYPKAGACFTLARVSNWHICDEWGNVEYDVEKVYEF